MKKTLFKQIFRIYLLIGIGGFLFSFLLGSWMFERNLIHTTGQRLYQEASVLASDSSLRYQASKDTMDSFFLLLPPIAASQGIEIWLMNHEGDVFFKSSDSSVSEENPVPVPNFSPISWGNHTYSIGSFYQLFSEPQLTTLATISSNVDVYGYLAIHYPMSSLYAARDQRLRPLLIIYISTFFTFFFILLYYVRRIYRPFQDILKGAKELSQGNLNHRIPTDRDGELGYLADTMNYMAEHLSRESEYNRNMISNISHDFRSPLTSIKGYVEAILDGVIPVELQDKYLRIISFEANRLEKLTRGIIALNNLDTKKQRLTFTDFDINNTLRQIAASFEGQCREKWIQISLILHGEVLLVRADQEQIQQVLYNLIDNAIKFSNSSSTIKLETAIHNDKVYVSVKDFGCGISKEELPKIWDRFYKADISRGKHRSGTGLGLSIAKEILKAHGQTIDCISTEGAGTEFIFTLSPVPVSSSMRIF